MAATHLCVPMPKSGAAPCCGAWPSSVRISRAKLNMTTWLLRLRKWTLKSRLSNESRARNMPDDQSAMIDHSVAMSPSEATSVLDGMIADLRSPVPLVPTNANEARQRLNALSSDASWVKKYLEGD